jgi:glycerol-3-phosphate dehydrogenase
VRELARRHAIEMPIVEAVYAVLFEKISVRDVVEALLARESRAETR